MGPSADLRTDVFQALFEAAPDGVVLVAADGRIALANAQAAGMFGYAVESLVGQPVEALLPERLRSLHVAHRGTYQRRPATRPMGAGLDLVGYRCDGTEFPVEISLSPLQTEEGTLVIATVRDVTERKHAEQATRQLAALVESAEDAIISTDLLGIILTWNPGAARMFGYSAHEAIGRDIDLIIPAEGQEEERRLRAAIVHGAHVQNHEAVRRRKDDTRLDVSLTLSPIRDARGAVLAISRVCRDITERKRAEAEVKALNGDLDRRLAEIAALNRDLEAFSGWVSHDLRAPLRAIDGFTHALQEEYADALGAEGRGYVERVRANVARMGALLDALLKLARVSRQEMRREPVHLSAVARKIAARLQAAHPDRPVDLVIADEVIVPGDGELLGAALENLLGNAWKFTSKVARARIEFGTIPTEHGNACFVRDNGVGFDMARAGKLFTPLQRLHGAAEFPGTGLGLAVVHRIIERHGGRIWAEAEVGRGATFYFAL